MYIEGPTPNWTTPKDVISCLFILWQNYFIKHEIEIFWRFYSFLFYIFPAYSQLPHILSQNTVSIYNICETIILGGHTIWFWWQNKFTFVIKNTQSDRRYITTIIVNQIIKIAIIYILWDLMLAWFYLLFINR